MNQTSISHESSDSFAFVSVKKLSDSESVLKLYNDLTERFQEKFSRQPQMLARVPGRVNLIGEHIDYCGYPVCPIAIDRYISVAAASVDSDVFLKLINTDEENYWDIIVHSRNFDISLEKHGWGAYILCGIKGMIEKIKERNPDLTCKSMVMAVTGNIPPAAGLSSSSALVSAAALITASINGLNFTKSELATLCAEAEHYVGTAGGGMDQAIAFHGKEGFAKLIEFNPLRTTDVQIQHDAVFVIAHSLITKNKAASADFNIRVVECRIAAQVLAKNGKLENWKTLTNLADVQNALSFTLSEIIKVVEGTFHEEPYTKEEICKILEVSTDELNKLTLTPNTYNVKSFKLRKRALHVYKEAERVYTWQSWCSDKKDLKQLGMLLLGSHDSLQNLYECSHAELDTLVAAMVQGGAYGARLTGAGWGGCVVGLTLKKNVQHLVNYLKDNFYKNKVDDVNCVVFAAIPGDGAELFSSD